MASRLKAKVQPAVLVWARESAGYGLEKAADGLKISHELLASWEAGSDAPSIPQLRKLAELYKRPLAVMYLAFPPMMFQAMRDFRRLPGSSMLLISPAIVIEERRARQRRELALDLATELGEPIPEFNMTASVDEDPEEVAKRLRAELGITSELQGMWRDVEGRKAFKGWRQCIEAKGVLVFQSDKFASEEASGFAIWESIAPIVVISRKASHHRRRTFSLLHEFSHLLVRASGVSDLDVDANSRRPPEELKVEIFCNSVAAAALIPESDLLSQQLVKNHPVTESDWTDEELSEIAKSFGVSREVVLRRLLTYRRTTTAFYEESRARYQEEWEQYRVKQKTISRPDGIPRNMPQEALSNLGRPFVGMVIERYHQDGLSLSEVSGYLGLKSKHIGKVEQIMRGG